MMKSIYFTLAVVIVSCTNCLNVKNYEANSQDPLKKNIAILAYGSLINQPTNETNGVKLNIDGQWQETEIILPISLLRLSSKGKVNERATRVVDQINGTMMKIWFAQSMHRTLADAMQNLAGREGAPRKNDEFNTSNIFYIKKTTNDTTHAPQERRIAGLSRNDGIWLMRNVEDQRQLSETQASTIARWALANNFIAVIWASFPTNQSREQIRSRLQQNRRTLINTQGYLKNLPAKMPLTPFEQEIMRMN